MEYKAAEGRYGEMEYRRAGTSGVKLPAVSLGLWQNFGDVDDFAKGREILLKAFDNGITYFDLANNYGPSPGSSSAPNSGQTGGGPAERQVWRGEETHNPP